MRISVASMTRLDTQTALVREVTMVQAQGASISTLTPEMTFFATSSAKSLLVTSSTLTNETTVAGTLKVISITKISSVSTTSSKK